MENRFDSDWNPHADLQAQHQAHHIDPQFFGSGLILHRNENGLVLITLHLQCVRVRIRTLVISKRNAGGAQWNVLAENFGDGMSAMLNFLLVKCVVALIMF